MPMCTFLDEHQQNIPTRSETLNELLADVREATGDNWQIRELPVHRTRLFRKPVVTYKYELLVEVGGFPSWQVINFYREGAISINPTNTAELVAAYLLGVLSEHRQKQW